MLEFRPRQPRNAPPARKVEAPKTGPVEAEPPVAPGIEPPADDAPPVFKPAVTRAAAPVKEPREPSRHWINFKHWLSQLEDPAYWRARGKYVALLGVLGLILLAPYLLRPSNRPPGGKADGTLIILTPHNESIKREIGAAFTAWYQKKTGKVIAIDWRTPGGTSDIAKIINSDYKAAFEHYWHQNTGKFGPWQPGYGAVFNDSKLDAAAATPGKPAAQRPPEARVRDLFLESNVGIGVDLFFGGGSPDFEKQNKAGYLVAKDPSGKFGLSALNERNPELFKDTVIPLSVSGEPYRDPGFRWVGNCLSSFGIVYNKDVLKRLGLPEPKQWADLADPRYFGQIALADPTKSGSVVKAFEAIIQQQMRLVLEEAAEEIKKLPEKMQKAKEDEKLSVGWTRGLALIQRIGANTRYFTDSSTKVPSDVASGVAAAGMCIDFFGRTLNERVKDRDGNSRVGFVTPEGGSSVSVDPFAMLRGAPHPEVADAFMEFVLSIEGQSVWCNKVGAPGGPQRHALRRLPIRKDMYTPDRLVHSSDPEEFPYQKAEKFFYKPEWTAGSFDVIRIAVKTMCIDTHDELQAAWQTLAEKGFPKLATESFGDLRQLEYKSIRETVKKAYDGKEMLGLVKINRSFGFQFRKQYEVSMRQANAGK